MKLHLYVFKWKGKNKNGQIISGEIRSANITSAKSNLLKRGINVTSISYPSFIDWFTQKTIPFDLITSLVRQLASILEAGIPLIQSFEILIKSQNQPRIIQLLDELKFNLISGLSLADSFNQLPDYFNDYFCSLIKAGEASGTLEQMLKNLVKHREKLSLIKHKIKNTMIYPMIVLILTIIVSMILLIFVIPKFQSIYQGYGAQLPAYTLFIINLSQIVQTYWWLNISGMICCYFITKFLYANHSKFKHTADKLILKIPVLGVILQKSICAKFSQTMAITFAAGLSLFDTIKLIKNILGNELYIKAVELIHQYISSGLSLNEAMNKTKIFPVMMIQMIAIGEQTGNMEEMLGKLASYYEQEVDNAVNTLNTVLEPLILLILGIIVGSLVIAMYLPMFRMTTLM